MHSKLPADKNTKRQEGRNINKDTETSCQPAQRMLIMFKSVLGTRYILGPYPFFILFGLVPRQLTLSKNGMGEVSLDQ